MRCFPQLMEWMQAARREERENNRGTNCLCHSSKTQTVDELREREREGETMKSADDPIIGHQGTERRRREDVDACLIIFSLIR